ncbi:50S ribosomal protein P1 [Candidatus Pacearchaeota archaeon CG10_big_fil_rev_8_21_14_0_10_32_14]|nr:MAG: 50S ribosomal protein P1 [Candidatus Pacearchaeota archaeon CG10_big_fil_rev_8_21_14_0_10_32_14]
MEYVYGVLLLHKTGQEINESNLKKVVAATGANVDESKVKSLIASLKGVNIDEQLANATLAVAAPASAGHAEAKAEAPKEEEKKEAAAEGLSALFG